MKNEIVVRGGGGGGIYEHLKSKEITRFRLNVYKLRTSQADFEIRKR